MSGYSEFARYYDELMCGVDYGALADYILRLFEKHDKKPALLLDIACGTGSLGIAFAKRGVDVIGCDASCEMLSIARQKADLKGCRILFLMQKMQEIDLYGTVDGAVSTFDSLNHITDLSQLETVLKRAGLFIEDGGLFIFDINTVYKHTDVLADNAFVFETEKVYCVWQNRYDRKKALTEIDIDLFVPEDKKYRRFRENFFERAYTVDEIAGAVNNAGFEILAVYGDMTFAPPKDNEQRVFYVIKKKGRTA